MQKKLLHKKELVFDCKPGGYIFLLFAAFSLSFIKTTTVYAQPVVINADCPALQTPTGATAIIIRNWNTYRNQAVFSVTNVTILNANGQSLYSGIPSQFSTPIAQNATSVFSTRNQFSNNNLGFLTILVSGTISPGAPGLGSGVVSFTSMNIDVDATGKIVSRDSENCIIGINP